MNSFVGSMRGASLPRRSWYGIAGAALLIASGAIHLDLYVTGYNSIPTIGPLFLLQIIAAFVLAVAIPLTGHRLAYLAGAGFGLATLGGYLLTHLGRVPAVGERVEIDGLLMEVLEVERRRIHKVRIMPGETVPASEGEKTV